MRCSVGHENVVDVQIGFIMRLKHCREDLTVVVLQIEVLFPPNGRFDAATFALAVVVLESPRPALGALLHGPFVRMIDDGNNRGSTPGAVNGIVNVEQNHAHELAPPRRQLLAVAEVVQRELCCCLFGWFAILELVAELLPFTIELAVNPDEVAKEEAADVNKERCTRQKCKSGHGDE